MRILFIENEDSFSWNVIDALPVSRSDLLIQEGSRLPKDFSVPSDISAVVLGPGPTDPVRAELIHFTQEIVRSGMPFLGICLGHQALGLAFGASLVRTPPAHGQVSSIRVGASRLFSAFEGPQTVMRYHSLTLTEVPSPLRVIARSENGLVMAIEHEQFPAAGLQFHPDSYATPRGRKMIAAFFEAVA